MIKYSPKMTKEIHTKCPRPLSSYHALHQVIEKYALLNLRLNKCFNPELHRSLADIIYKERLLLTLDGDVNAACDILPIVNNKIQKELLCLMIISLKARGSFSLSDVKKIIHSISLINHENTRQQIFEILKTLSDEIMEMVCSEVILMENNEYVKLDILKNCCYLPLSEKMTIKIYRELRNILRNIEDNDEKSYIFMSLGYLNLSQKQREELFNIAKQLPGLTMNQGEEPDETDETDETDSNPRLLAFEALCDLKLSTEEVDQIFNIACEMRYEFEKVKLFAALCKFSLSDKQKSEIFNNACTMQPEYKARLFAALYKCNLPDEQRREIFNAALKMRIYEQTFIFPTLCEFELSEDDRNAILNNTTSMRNDGGKTTILIKLCKLHNLSKEERAKIVNIAKNMIEMMNYRSKAADLLAALYRPELSENEKEEIYAIINGPFTCYPNEESIIFRKFYERETSEEAKAKIFSIVLSRAAKYSISRAKILINFYASNPSKEEKNQIFQLLETIDNENDKAKILLDLSANIQWSSDEVKKIASLALQINNPGIRRDIFAALASNNNRSNEHEQLMTIENNNILDDHENTIIIEEVIE